MAIWQKFKGYFQKEADKFNVTASTTWDDYSFLLESNNYLDQYFGWTYRAIKIKADAIASYPIKLRSIKNEADIEVSQSSYLSDLYHFNDYQTLTDARKLTTIHLALTGMAFWVIFKSESAGHNFDFFILNPQKVSMKTNAFGLPEYYTFHDEQGRKQRIDPENIIVFKEANPHNFLKGYSPLQASRYSHNAWELASKFNMNMFGNSATPEGFLSVKDVDEETRKRIEKQLQQKYGGVNNARKIGVTSQELEWIPITKTQKELDFTEGLRMMKQDILGMHGVPAVLVDPSDATYANSAEAQRIFQMYTLKPMLDDEASVHNEQSLTKYYISSKDRLADLEVYFDDPVESDTDKDSQVAERLFMGGIIRKDEAREMVGLTPLGAEQGGEEFFTIGTTEPVRDEEAEKQIKGMSLKFEQFIKTVSKVPEINEILQKDRDMLRDYFHQKAVEQEQDFKGVVDSYFTDQMERVLKQFTPKKAPGMNVDFDLDAETAVALKAFFDAYNSIAGRSNDEANDFTPSDIKIAISREARKKLNANLEYFAGEINKTTRDDLLKLISTAVSEGYSTDQTAEEIRNLFGKYMDNGEKLSRSEMIARTETGKIRSLITRDVYAQDDLVDGMEWLTAQDAFVRGVDPKDDFSHISADGQVVPKGAKFKVSGEYLEYPGDPSGSAGNTIQCRCVILPVVRS